MLKLDHATWAEVVGLVAVPFAVIVATTSSSHVVRAIFVVVPFALLLTIEFTDRRLRARAVPSLQDERERQINLRSNAFAFHVLKIGALVGSLTEAGGDHLGPFFGLFVLSLVAPLVASIWFEVRA